MQRKTLPQSPQLLNLNAKTNPNWPPLAWLARIRADRDEIELLHGRGVEIGDDWFAEAVWDGPFEKSGFDQTDLIYGSGARLRDNRWTFVSSSTTMDRLQYFHDGKDWLVSNSLACLLAAMEADVSSLYSAYRRDFGSIILGLDQCSRQLHTTRGNVQLVYYDNLSFQQGKLTEVRKPTSTRDVSTYLGYREFLESALVRCAENMRSPQRTQQYEWLGTISTGFDSPTVVALARKAGLQEVITFGRARDNLDDDGSTIAARLGVSIRVLDRDAWQTGALTEVPFLASDAKGEDVYFAGAEALLQQRVLLTGYAAGAWAAKGRANPALGRADQSGLSLTEYRLWANFINLAVPTMGVQSATQDDLDARSQELAPWASGNSYDKPFSRRVLTEAGVPENLFGQENKAASVLTFDRRSFLSSEAKQDFLKHLAQAREKQPLLGLLLRLRDWSLLLGARLTKTLQQSCRAIDRLIPLPIIRKIARSGRINEWAYFEPRCDHLFPWALRHAKRRYTDDEPSQQVLESEEPSQLEV